MSTNAVRSRAHSKRRWVREIALTVGALAGLLCVLIALAAVVFGITPLVFRSGSMSPAIETGALAVSKTTPAVDIQVGDIVNVTNAAGNGITHRVIEIGAVGNDSVELYLKGDDNAEPDAEPYVVSEAGRVLFSVPKLGYAVTWLSGPVAVFAGGVLVGVLLMVAFRPRRVSPSETDEEPHGRHSRLPTSGLVVLATLGAVALSSTNPPVALAAPLTDTSTATSGEFTTVAPLPPLPVPGDPTCVNKPGVLGLIGNYVTVSWPSAGAGYTYKWTLTQSGQPDATGTVTSPTVDIENGLLLFGTRTGTWNFSVQTVSGTRQSIAGRRHTLIMSLTTSSLNLLPAARCGVLEQQSRVAPQAIPAPTTTSPPETTTPLVPSTTPPATTTTPPATTTTPPTTTTTEPPPAAVEPPPAPVTTTTTTAAPPADLISPQSSPSGSAVAKVVSVDGSPTLQITDSSGDMQYSGPISSSSEYGYGVAWASGDQLWLLGPSQLVRLDGTDGGWSRTVVDPASGEVPAEISALLN
ncbi:signal peptidase I [Rhodococcoides fascians]|uniref:signal peptidase I n=1 Tax=Rhodococcoides fascians TaxID=1828 RepID=UPI001E34542F|nr:signal peptidase I [Rhodococcus fascians]